MAITTTVNLSNLEFRNRIDGELYDPRLMESFFELKRSNLELIPINSFCSVKSGTTPKDRDDTLKEGPVLFKTTDIRNNVLSPFDTFYHISESIHNRMTVTKLKPYDVLINIVGATLDVIGRSSIIMDDFQEANITQAMAFLRIRKKAFLPGYLFAFLNTKYAQNQIKRYARPTGQFNLNLVEVGKLMIPELPFTHQQNIENLIAECAAYQKQSHVLYHQAETLLAQELHLDQLTFPNKKWYTADYCEVVNERRMNAEFFSPDVYYILSQGFLKEGATINDVFEIIRGYTPKCYYQSGVPVVKTKNVRTPNIDKKRISDCADSQEPLTQIKENDLILAAMGVGSLGRMSYVTAEETNCAIDGTLRILRKKDLSLNDMEIPTMLFLSTEIGQKLIYRGISGTTGIISLPDDYLERIPIPVIEKSVRRKVTELVLNSIKAKNQSEQLLAQAKQRVEELIEQEANKYNHA